MDRTDEVPLPRHFTSGGVTITESHPDVFLRETVTPRVRVTFIRLKGGQIPATTLTGEAQVDVGPDGSILGVTVEVWNDAGA